MHFFLKYVGLGWMALLFTMRGALGSGSNDAFGKASRGSSENGSESEGYQTIENASNLLEDSFCRVSQLDAFVQRIRQIAMSLDRCLSYSEGQIPEAEKMALTVSRGESSESSSSYQALASSLESMIRQLVEKVRKEKLLREDLNTSKASINGLQASVSELEASIIKLKKQNDKLEKNNLELKNEKSALMKVKIGLSKTISESERGHSLLEAEYEKLSSEYSDLKNMYDKFDREARTTSFLMEKKHQSEVERLSALNEALEEKNIRCMDALENSKREQEFLRLEVCQKEEEVKGFKQALSGFSQIVGRERIDISQISLRTGSPVFVKSRESLTPDDLSQTLETVMKQNRDLKRELEEQEEDSKMEQETKENLLELQEWEINRYKEKVKEEKKKCEDLIKEHERQVEEYKKELAKRDRMIEEYREKEANLSKSFEEQSARSAEREKKVRKLVEYVTKIRSERGSAREDIALKEKDIAELQRRLEETVEEVKREREKWEERETVLEARYAQEKKAREKAYRVELAEREKEIEYQKKKGEALEAQLAQEKKALEENYRKQIERHKEQVDEEIKLLQMKNQKERERLEKDYKKLKDKLRSERLEELSRIYRIGKAKEDCFERTCYKLMEENGQLRLNMVGEMGSGSLKSIPSSENDVETLQRVLAEQRRENENLQKLLSEQREENVRVRSELKNLKGCVMGKDPFFFYRESQSAKRTSEKSSPRKKEIVRRGKAENAEQKIATLQDENEKLKLQLELFKARMPEMTHVYGHVNRLNQHKKVDKVGLGHSTAAYNEVNERMQKEKREKEKMLYRKK